MTEATTIDDWTLPELSGLPSVIMSSTEQRPARATRIAIYLTV